MHFRISLINSSTRQTIVIKHCHGLNSLWTNLNNWFSNCGTASRNIRLSGVSIPYRYIPVSRKSYVLPDLLVAVDVVGELGTKTIEVYSLIPWRRNIILARKREITASFRYLFSSLVAPTDSSGKDDEFDSVLRYIISSIIRENFS